MSIETFQIVTGPKTDHLPTGRESDDWLVMTVGALVTAVALALLVAAWQRRNQSEMVILAIGCAVALVAIDIVYVTREVIRPIYLADAAVEIVFIVAWAAALARSARRPIAG